MLLQEKIDLLEDGLAQVQALTALRDIEDAGTKARQVLLQILLPEDISRFIPPFLSDSEMNTRLQGLLIERLAFYKQLQNSEHWVTHLRTLS